MTTEAKVQDRTAVDVALLIARVIVGIVFMAHGAQKLFGAFGGLVLSAFVQMMGPFGYLAAIGEFFGGLGLAVGFLARFSAASITLIMLGAIAIVHAKAGFFMNWTGKQAGEGFEYQCTQQQRGSALQAERVELIKAARTGEGEHTGVHRLGVGIGIVRKTWRVLHRSAECQPVLWLTGKDQR